MKFIQLFLLLAFSASVFAQESRSSEQKTTSEIITTDESEVLTEEFCKVSGGKNAQYIDFKVKNNSGKRINAYVRGPKEKRFSYGFPLNPYQKRAKNWPVGSKVYLEGKLGTRKYLTTIKAEDENQVVELFR